MGGKLIATIILFGLILSWAFLTAPTALSKNLSGEISTVSTSVDQSTNYPRLREFRTYPQGMSVSNLRLEYANSDITRFNLDSKSTGEDDTETLFQMTRRDWLTLKLGDSKIPHIIDHSANLQTERNITSFSMNLLPLKPTKLEIFSSNEDKVGDSSSNEKVGQKNREKQIVVDSKEIDRTFTSLKYRTGKLYKAVSDNKVKELSGSIMTDTTLPYYLSLDYGVLKYSPGSANQADRIKITQTQVDASTDLTGNVTLFGDYRGRRFNNMTPSTVSTNEHSYELGFSCLPGKSTTVDFSYENQQKSFTNTDISDQDINTYEAKLKTRMPWMVVKVDYSNQNRDANGITMTDRFNIDEISSKITRFNYSVSSTHFTKGGITLFGETKGKQYDSDGFYGAATDKSVMKGFSAYYLFSPKVTLTTSNISSQLRLGGRFLFGGNDQVFDVYQANEYFQIGGDYSLSDRTTLSLGYIRSFSDVLDPFANNIIGEKVNYYSIAHELTPILSIEVNYTQNKYNDGLDTAYNGISKILEFEIKGKF